MAAMDCHYVLRLSVFPFFLFSFFLSYCFSSSFLTAEIRKLRVAPPGKLVTPQMKIQWQDHIRDTYTVLCFWGLSVEGSPIMPQFTPKSLGRLIDQGTSRQIRKFTEQTAKSKLTADDLFGNFLAMRFWRYVQYFTKNSPK